MEIKSREDFEKLKQVSVFKGVIVSDSMEPLINIGDKIVVEVNNRVLERFDIIIFWMNGRLTCHYVWSMNRLVSPFLLQTRSIKYGQKDVPINWDDYLGKVISHKLSVWDKFKIYVRLKLKEKN